MNSHIFDHMLSSLIRTRQKANAHCSLMNTMNTCIFLILHIYVPRLETHLRWESLLLKGHHHYNSNKLNMHPCMYVTSRRPGHIFCSVHLTELPPAKLRIGTDLWTPLIIYTQVTLSSTTMLCEFQSLWLHTPLHLPVVLHQLHYILITTTCLQPPTYQVPYQESNNYYIKEISNH